jgi:diadenosine tetraphosphate (Ap4A) HIT family hydrolase
MEMFMPVLNESSHYLAPQLKRCKSCEWVKRRDAGEAPFWDCIHRTEFWDVAHSHNTALPGWMILIARRHMEAIEELSEAEAAELGLLLRQVSIALKEITGCLKTYVLQFAEHEDHPHVHFHVIPRMADQPENRRSTQIFGYLGVPEAERVSEQKMNEVAARMQQLLLAEGSFDIEILGY